MASRFFVEEEFADDSVGIKEYWNSPLVPLEVAIRSLYAIIPRINELVAKAKAKCFISPDGLTHDETAAIYLYTMEVGKTSIYRMVNWTLRKKDHFMARPWLLYLKLFATGVRKLPLYSGNVWRAVPGDVAKHYKKYGRIRWWAYTSCTKSISILDQFIPQSANDRTIFMIECIRGRNIAPYSAYGKEDEILLVSGTTLIAADESLMMAEVRMVHLKEVSAGNLSSTPNSNQVVDKNTTAVSLYQSSKWGLPKTPKGTSN
ncbi:unnamed protein product [Adineta ricciae]|uniref:NAD(P)(+)--arginine ADP-ribosyltransferase n=1 Tax=Adineta ricciae TaxID=249248 RepID=A0A815W696_ADIRI|nr:unnamed protein product [Adineta ricciae]CAF1650557.1 unnamed protein product [Adineta ricciae]